MAKYSGTSPAFHAEIYLPVIPRTADPIIWVEENTIQLLFGLHCLSCAEMQNSFMHTPVVRYFFGKALQYTLCKYKVRVPILDWAAWGTTGRFPQLCIIALIDFRVLWLLLWVLTQNDIRWSIPNLSIWIECNNSKISMIHAGLCNIIKLLKTMKARPCAMVIKTNTHKNTFQETLWKRK